MVVVQRTTELLACINIAVKGVKGLLFLYHNIVRDTFLFEFFECRAVLCIKDIFCLILRNHSGGVGQFAQVVLKCLRPLIMAVVGKEIVQVQVALCAIECDCLAVEDSTAVADVTDTADLFTVQVQFDAGVVAATTCYIDGGRLNDYRHCVFLGTLERTLYQCRLSCLAVDSSLIAAHIETCSAIWVVALDEFRICILDVLGSKGKLNGITCGAFGG